MRGQTMIQKRPNVGSSHTWRDFLRLTPSGQRREEALPASFCPARSRAEKEKHKMTEQTQIRQTENQSAEPQVHTGGARYGAEREERTNNKPMISWAALLDEAVSKPGFIHHAYRRFWNYSLGNQLLALFQCFERGITPGP